MEDPEPVMVWGQPLATLSRDLVGEGETGTAAITWRALY
jgi:hypothetical protein